MLPRIDGRQTAGVAEMEASAACETCYICMDCSIFTPLGLA
jgi:hypothetical protein